MSIPLIEKSIKKTRIPTTIARMKMIVASSVTFMICSSEKHESKKEASRPLLRYPSIPTNPTKQVSRTFPSNSSTKGWAEKTSFNPVDGIQGLPLGNLIGSFGMINLDCMSPAITKKTQIEHSIGNVIAAIVYRAVNINPHASVMVNPF